MKYANSFCLFENNIFTYKIYILRRVFFSGRLVVAIEKLRIYTDYIFTTLFLIPIESSESARDKVR
jgi:hypothetical protein